MLSNFLLIPSSPCLVLLPVHPSTSDFNKLEAAKNLIAPTKIPPAKLYDEVPYLHYLQRVLATTSAQGLLKHRDSSSRDLLHF